MRLGRPFPDRERELSRRRVALGRGYPAAAGVEDAEVGKTRFLREGLRLAAPLGLVAVWGACLQLAGRLPLPPAPAATGGRDKGWQRERLFSGLAELSWAVARRSALAVVIDEVQWAGSESLDVLTLLIRAVRAEPVTVVAACRSDEAPLDAHVAGWLA